MNNIKYIYPRGHRPLVLNPKDPTETEVLASRGEPRGCIAYTINEVEGCPDTMAVHWGYSVWNQKRTFKKVLARSLAKERLETDYLVTFCRKTQRPSEMIADVLRDISRCSTHHWAGKDDLSEEGKICFVHSPLSSKFRQACRITEKRIHRRLNKNIEEAKAA